MFQNEYFAILKLQNDLFIALSKLFKYNKILILKLQRKVSNHRKCDSKKDEISKYFKMVLGLFTIENIVLHQEFIKSQQKNDDDAN
jgi:hypothetical protein